MSISATAIDRFLEKQVKLGACSSTEEAQQELLVKLIEKDIDEKIARGRADVKAGKVREFNSESNTQFLAELEKKLTAIV